MYQSIEDAMSLIRPGQKLFIQTGAAAPQDLICGLTAKANELSNRTIYQMDTEGEAPYGNPEWKDVFKSRYSKL